MFFFDDGAASERAETKEKSRASTRRMKLETCVCGLELHVVEATEYENGDGVGRGGCAEGVDARGDTLAIGPQEITKLPPCFISLFLRYLFLSQVKIPCNYF